MNCYAFSYADEAEYIVAGLRCATRGQGVVEFVFVFAEHQAVVMRGFFVGCYFRRSHDRSAPEQVGEETSSRYELFESVVVHQSFPDAVEHLLRCFGFEKRDEFIDCFFIQFDLQVAQFAGQP